MGEGDRLVFRREDSVPVVQAVESNLFALLGAIANGLSLEHPVAGRLDLEPLPSLIAAGWIGGFTARPD